MRHDLPFSLVTIGGGAVRPPAAVADRVVDLGFLPDADRDAAFAAAEAYLQPSRNEAFSRTVMEAWLAGTPVVANAASDVVAWHCKQSGTGLLYADHEDFARHLRFLADAPPTPPGRLREGARMCWRATSGTPCSIGSRPPSTSRPGRDDEAAEGRAPTTGTARPHRGEAVHVAQTSAAGSPPKPRRWRVHALPGVGGAYFGP